MRVDIGSVVDSQSAIRLQLVDIVGLRLFLNGLGDVLDFRNLTLSKMNCTSLEYVRLLSHSSCTHRQHFLRFVLEATLQASYLSTFVSIFFRVQEKDRIFCPCCDASFAAYSQCFEHMRVAHLGAEEKAERPSCPRCSKTFKSAASLRSHVLRRRCETLPEGKRLLCISPSSLIYSLVESHFACTEQVAQCVRRMVLVH